MVHLSHRDIRYWWTLVIYRQTIAHGNENDISDEDETRRWSVTWVPVRIVCYSHFKGEERSFMGRGGCELFDLKQEAGNAG